MSKKQEKQQTTQTKEHTEEFAYNDGFVACQEGWSKEGCIYKDDGHLRDAWLEGWQTSNEEREEE